MLFDIILIILALCVLGNFIALAWCVREIVRMYRKWARP